MENIKPQRNYVKSLVKAYDKMQKKPAYKYLSMILGIFTAVFVFVCNRLNGDDKESELIVRQAEAALQRDNVKERIRQEASVMLKNKIDYFHEEMSSDKFEKRLTEITERRYEELIMEGVRDISAGGGEPLKGYVNTYERLMNNRLFFIASLVLSFPMYILMAIYMNPYVKYIFERVLMMAFVLLGVIVLTFTILYFSPMDPAVNILGQLATQEQVESFNEVYGLNEPYIVQLGNAIRNIFTFNLGKSFQGNENIGFAIARKFPVTLQVTFASFIVSLGIAIPAGIVSSIKQYSSFDYAFMFVALLGLSIPNFWLGLVLILNFSIHLGWLPASYSAGNWMTLIMPAIVLGTGMSASVARMTRSSMLEVKNQEYIMTAKAKGLSERSVVLKHMLGNAMIPIVTLVGMQFGGMLGGSAVTEKVFNISGIGAYIVDKQFVPDIPAVLAGVVYVSLIISVMNLLVDILYSFLDPRIKSKMKNY